MRISPLNFNYRNQKINNNHQQNFKGISSKADNKNFASDVFKEKLPTLNALSTAKGIDVVLFDYMLDKNLSKTDGTSAILIDKNTGKPTGGYKFPESDTNIKELSEEIEQYLIWQDSKNNILAANAMNMIIGKSNSQSPEEKEYTESLYGDLIDSSFSNQGNAQRNVTGAAASAAKKEFKEGVIARNDNPNGLQMPNENAQEELNKIIKTSVQQALSQVGNEIICKSDAGKVKINEEALRQTANIVLNNIANSSEAEYYMEELRYNKVFEEIINEAMLSVNGLDNKLAELTFDELNSQIADEVMTRAVGLTISEAKKIAFDEAFKQINWDDFILQTSDEEA